MEKTVFISHSSKDHDFAQALCGQFEAEGLYCWIAPRDIHYGSEWAGEISEAIRSARILIFIFSDNSNQSEQVVREIQLALQYGLTVITLRISSQPYNRALEYYLSTLHWAEMKEQDDAAVMSAFVQQVRSYMTGAAADPIPGSRLRLPEQTELNLDSELNAFMKKTFGETGGSDDKPPVSPMRERLLRRICDNFVEQTYEKTMAQEGSGADRPAGGTAADAVEGTFFQYAETEGSTLVYIVNEVYSLPDYRISYRADQCVKEVSTAGDGTRMAAFHLDPDLMDETGNALLLFSFLPDRNMVIVNMGLLEGGQVRVGRSPSYMQLASVSGDEDGRGVRYRADRDSTCIIIDPDNMTQLSRYRYYDKDTGEWRYCIDVETHKKYFVFQLSPKKDTPLPSPCDIGEAYMKGSHGLPVNTLEAADWLDRAATPRAYRLLAEIFRTDPLLASEEDAAYYEELAAQSEI